MIIADHSDKRCFKACDKREPCSCRNRTLDKKLVDKLAQKKD